MESGETSKLVADQLSEDERDATARNIEFVDDPRGWLPSLDRPLVFP